MRSWVKAFAAVAVVAGCFLKRLPVPEVSEAREPLGEKGEVLVFVQPLPRNAEGLEWSVGGVWVPLDGGTPVEMTLEFDRFSYEANRTQRLFFSGRLPPGAYDGFLVRLGRAWVKTEDGTADLVVSDEPDRVAAPFVAVRGKTAFLRLAFRAPESIRGGVTFSPALAPLPRESPLPALAAYVSHRWTDHLFVLDRRAREVVNAVATGRTPRGLALDSGRQRIFVTLEGEGEVAVVDTPTGVELKRIRLGGPGDRPVDVALTPGGRLLVTANEGSDSASVIDASSFLEVARLPCGREPGAVLADRTGSRAYVFNGLGNTVTVLDLFNRRVAGNIATDAEPLRGQLDRRGTRLYVAHRGSPDLIVYSLPDLGQVKRVFVGLGVTAIKVDPRSDLIYVANHLDREIRVYDPLSDMPIEAFEVADRVAQMVIDDLENALYLLEPDRHAIEVKDLTSRKTVATMDVAYEPASLALAGERR